MNKNAIITRQKIAKRGGKFAWYWCYSVNGISIGTTVAEAESYCRRKGWKPVRQF